MSQSKEHIHLRFQAVVITSQLPHNPVEALLVLDYARQMVMEFFDHSSDSIPGTIENKLRAPPHARGRFTVQ